MNLELLFYVAQEFGNKEYYDIAISHLDRTAKDLIRVCGVLGTALVVCCFASLNSVLALVPPIGRNSGVLIGGEPHQNLLFRSFRFFRR
jgi:hypothetical protein